MSSFCYKRKPLVKRRHKVYKKRLLLYRIKLIIKVSLFISLTTFLLIIFKNIFKIREIKINSDVSFYKHEDYIKAGNITVGRDFLFLNTDKVRQNIEEKLPFAKVSNMSKKFPGKLVLSINKADSFAAFRWNKNFVITDPYLKILEIKDNIEPNINLIEGVEIFEPKPGFKIKIKDNEKKLLTENLLHLMKDNYLNCSLKINISNNENINLDYEDRIFIKFGSSKDLERKIKALKEILNNKVKSKEKGNLDFTMFSENNKLYFMPIKENGKQGI